MEWRPIAEAAGLNAVHARDDDGQEAWTWRDGDEWMRDCWRETPDREEYRSEEWWTPVEFLPEQQSDQSEG